MTYEVERQWENEQIVIRLSGVNFNKSFPITLSDEEIIEAGKKTIEEYEEKVAADSAKAAEVAALKAEHEARLAKFEGIEIEKTDTVADVEAKQTVRLEAIEAAQIGAVKIKEPVETPIEEELSIIP